MEKKEKMPLKKKILIGIGIYFSLALIGILLYILPDLFVNKTKKEVRTEDIIKEEVTITPQMPLDERINLCVNKANSWEYITNVLINEDDKIANILSVTSGGFTEDLFIKSCCIFGIEATKEIFSHCSEINETFFVFQEPLMDSYGNVNMESVFSFGIKRKEFMKVNYKNFNAMINIDYNNLWNIANDIYISPQIITKLKKLKY